MKIRFYLIFGILLSTQLFSYQKYEVECNGLLLDYSRTVLLKQVGTLESGQNRGKKIEEYLKSVGLNPGNSYCAAGQYYCFADACRQLGLSSAFIPIPRTGLANAIFNFFQVKGKKVNYKPKTDDLIVWIKSNKVNGHIERIIEADKAGWVQTVGFNSSGIINGRKVEGVFIKKRNIFHAIGRMNIRGLAGFKTV